MGYLDYPGLQRYHGKVQEEIDELKDDLSDLLGEVTLFDGVSSFNQVLFTSSDVDIGATVSYYIKLPANPNRNRDGYIELYDANSTRLGIYGRTSEGNQDTEFSGTFSVPSGFVRAVWHGNETPISVIVKTGQNTVVRCDIAQDLTDEEKTQARENIGAVGATYHDVIFYDASASVGTQLFTSDDAPEGTHVTYDILMPVASGGYGAAGFIELVDSQYNRLGTYGRTATSQHAETVYQGEFDIPEGFDHANWYGPSGQPTSNATSVKLTKRVEGEINYYVRYDEHQNLTDEQKAQARENIGVSEGEDIIFSGTPVGGDIIFTNADVSVGDILFFDLDVSPYSGSAYIYFHDTNDGYMFFIGKPNVLNIKFKSVGCVRVPENFGYAKVYRDAATTTLTVNYIKKVVDYDIIAKERMNLYYGDRIDLAYMSGFNQYKAYVAKTGEQVTNNNAYTTTPISVIPGSRLYVNFDLNSKSYGTLYYDMEMNFLCGESSIGKTYFQVPDNASFAALTIPASSLATMHIIMESPLKQSVEESETAHRQYERVDLHRYGTSYLGYTHIVSGSSWFYDNKIYATYALNMRHDPTKGSGNIGGLRQVDTISMDGIRTHLKTITPQDFGFSASSASVQYYPSICLAPSKDGQYLVGVAQVVEVQNSAYNGFHVFAVVCDKNMNILQYKAIENCRAFLYGSVLITPSGKVAFSTYTTGSEHVYLYTSDQAFSGSISSMTFTETEVFSKTETGYNVTETAFGYFNNKMVAICRNSSNTYGTLLKTTENLEGTSGWSNVAYLSNVLLEAPALIPYYKGKYLPVLARLRKTSEGVPVFGFLDVDNATVKALEPVDNTLMTAWNAPSSMTYFGGNDYGCLYYQETPGVPNQLATNESYAGVYFKKINACALVPQMMYWDTMD